MNETRKAVDSAVTLTVLDVVKNIDTAAKTVTDMFRTVVKNDPVKIQEALDSTTKVLEKLNNFIMNDGTMTKVEVILASLAYARATAIVFLEDYLKRNKEDEGTNTNCQ